MAEGDLPVSVWRRSSACDPVDCVEVALVQGEVRVRDSQRPTLADLTVCPESWETFLQYLCPRHLKGEIRTTIVGLDRGER
ncbi:DUF397 domain-containing protein [Streptomyces poonensis]|uniref:DUF397 domain-containing protein n=1 Tax=Streptomyces poonensis TaxID=68255 RepID=A0A918PB35_9ACTN|nr:DUF397 domain-containing protein [Streptomyces poonensis]GGY94984.1 hypothetical protein GCM10010365_12260 [Streptomyces poonensis]GLJ88757.1 hypothetical protein GCM10017589_13570 [Streptomyces poonensis]